MFYNNKFNNIDIRVIILIDIKNWAHYGNKSSYKNNIMVYLLKKL